MNKFISQIKDYGPLGFIIISALVAAAISYGSTQATASLTFNNHEIRIEKLEKDDADNAIMVAKMAQHVDDLWKDNGHHE